MPPKRKREDYYFADDEDEDEGKEEDFDNLQEMKEDSDEEFDLHIQPNGLPALPEFQQEGDIAQLPDNGYGQFQMLHEMGMEQMDGNFPAMPFNLNQNFQGFDEFDDANIFNFGTPPQSDEEGYTTNEDGQGVNFNPHHQGLNFQNNDPVWNMMNEFDAGFAGFDDDDSDMSNFATENESTSGSDWDGAGRIPRRFLNNYV